MFRKETGKRWKFLCFLFFTLFFFSYSKATLKPQKEPPKWLKPWTAPQVPDDYRSPGVLHKLMVERGDNKQLAILKKIQPWMILQYQKRKLFLISTDELNKIHQEVQAGLSIRDEQNLIRLRDRFFDTTVPQPEVLENLRLVPRTSEQLHMIQFIGPVRDDWISSLERIEGVTIVDYIPENAYLIWADSEARKSLGDWAEFQTYVQWHGPFHPAYKIHTAFDIEFDGEVDAGIQLVTHRGVDESLDIIREKARKVLRDTYTVGRFTNIIIKIVMSELENLARLEDVVNIEPWIEPELGGERQGQILAGNLNVAGSQPTGPGYLAWLNLLGFNTNFNFVVDVTDSGIDRGQTAAANLHQDFLDAGGNSRVTYVQRVSGINIDTTAANNIDINGHGTIDLAIVGGFNNTPDIPGAGTDFEDANGYQYGLGIAPYVQLGSSRIFSPNWTNPDFTELINAAYGNGARISSNSWGDRGGANGSYDMFSQEYDSLVRDARPANASDGGEEGNQDMIIVFIAGNSGLLGASTLWNVGSTAKNTLVVGASENWNQQAIGVGCWNNADADDIRDIAQFSSTGPTQDNRIKPDIMAPGVRIYGAASQDPGYIGDIVCDQYFPAGQTLYTWSSGTSHAAPAVAGGTALLRQWFLNLRFPAPSPAMTKAYLMNSSTYMTGVGANDDLPSNNQGMGRMNLGMAFDNTPRLLFDQVKTCHDSAANDATEIFTVNGVVATNTIPFRVTLAWTDAPGNSNTGVIRRNDLDLEVTVGGNFYRGNDFTGEFSNIGNVADPTDQDNNVESVYVPAGVTGNFTVTVRPANINWDGVPNNGDLTDQDFSLVIYNAELPARDPVDIIMVLDRSGSMNSIAAGGIEKKIELVKDSVEMFIRTWLPFSIPEDRMGIVSFNNGITKYPDSPTILLPFQFNANNFINNIRDITASQCTALGGGILTALRGFDNMPNHRKFIVVFSNGMQNCSPMVTEVSGSHQILHDPTPPCSDSGVPEEPGVNLADYDVKAIHTIGTGVAGADWIDLIQDIASETGGIHHFTSDPDEDLEDYFLEDLVNTLRFDPVEKIKTAKGKISKAQVSKTEMFDISPTVRKVTFALSWRGERRMDALTTDLIAPDDGTVIPFSVQNVQTGDFYRIVSVDFPLVVHGNQIDPSGTWELVIKQNLTTANEVTYRVHAIADDAEIRYHFEVPALDYSVGDKVPVSFWIQHNNRTVTNLGGKLEVNITKPPVGFGTFLVKHKVSKQQLAQPVDLSDDEFTHLAEKKGFILTQNSDLLSELNPLMERIVLYDDGKVEHGDAKSNDGVYSALYSNTTRPGFYNFQLDFQGTIPGLGKINRSETKTVSIRMKHFNMDNSKITIRPVRPTIGKIAYNVSVMLVDDYGNYLGPGHDLSVQIVMPGIKWEQPSRHVRLNDDLDGRYSGRVELTDEEILKGAELIFAVDGRRFTSAKRLPPFGKRSFSVHSGIAFPIGSLKNDFNSGVNVLLNLDYHFTPQLSLVGLFGYNNFKSKTSGVDDTYWINLSVNLKYRLLNKTVSPYINGGLGYYIPKTGDKGLGANLGFGLNYEFSSYVTFEVGADYHAIFGEDVQFLHTHAGVIFRF